MGRRLNVSTPTVINTELVPLDESFYLDVDGQMEQWYYDNTEQYAPNRKVTPLLLVPVISAFDKDTSTSYTPAFNTTQWFANEWNEAQGKYVETEITNQVDSGSADYVIQGNNLLVKKNVSYSHAVTIRCVATYIDPRDSGVTYVVEDSVNLTTNRTADVVFPEVDIISPSGRAYNPLVDDENSQYDFKGVTTNNPVQPLNTDVRRYPVDVDGTEEILNSGEAVAPIMDIHYGDNPTMKDQEFMYRQTAGGTLVGESIDKAYIERIKGNTVAWNQQISKTQSSQTKNGVSFVGNGDGTISVSGTATDFTMFIFGWVNATHRYFMKGCPEGGSTNSYYLRTYGGGVDFYDVGEGVVFTAPVSKQANIAVSAGTVIETPLVFVPQLFDLTIMYGKGNEPTTVEQFEADYERWFGKPLSYEEYDAGSLRPVLMQSVKTTGFNLWDGTFSQTGKFIGYDGSINGGSLFGISNYIKVFPFTEYHLQGTGGTNPSYCFYDQAKNFISGAKYYGSTSFNITSPSNAAYIVLSIPLENVNSFIINISNPSKDGTYEPYEEKVQGFDVTTIKGKLDGAGESVIIFPDGLKKAGDVQDEIFVEDGVVKAVKRVGSVDLGRLGWVYKSDATYFTHEDVSSILNIKSGGRWVNGVMKCGIYHITNKGSIDTTASLNMVMASWKGTNNCITIRNTSYTDAATFKAAMQGVMLYYELETPETYVLDQITDFVWYGIKNGQEVLADTLPWYVSGQGTDNLTVDAMYGENINVVLRCKMMDGETLSPSKAYATLNWRTPDIETFVQSDNGGAVRSDTEEMSFGTIVNVNGEVLSDALKRKHLAFNWKIRKNNTSTEIDNGWGQRITIDASDLRNVKGSGSTLASTLVSNDVYLKGAYEEVTDNGEVVTYNGEKVYDRPID